MREMEVEATRLHNGDLSLRVCSSGGLGTVERGTVLVVSAAQGEKLAAQLVKLEFWKPEAEQRQGTVAFIHGACAVCGAPAPLYRAEGDTRAPWCAKCYGGYTALITALVAANADVWEAPQGPLMRQGPCCFVADAAKILAQAYRERDEQRAEKAAEVRLCQQILHERDAALARIAAVSAVIDNVSNSYVANKLRAALMGGAGSEEG